jgi:hypothetical protein
VVFKPAYPQDLTNDLTKSAVVALNRPTFLDFCWNFATQTNAGRCFVIAILALGFFSSLGIVFTVLPIGSIPIVGYILTFSTGIGSFGALLAMLAFATPVVFTYVKKRDIWTFPSIVINGLKTITRCGVAIELLKQIDLNCLQLGEAGSNIKQIVFDLTSALATRAADEKKYGNAVTKYLEKLLSIKEVPQLVGAAIRAADAIMRLKRQECLNFEVLAFFDLILATIQNVKDYLFGKFDDVIHMEPIPPVSGVTQTILKITDGSAVDRNVQYKDASLKILREETVKTADQAQQVAGMFPFPVDPLAMIDLETFKDSEGKKENIGKVKAQVEACRHAATAELREHPVPVSPQTGMDLLRRYGCVDRITIKEQDQTIGGLPIPEEIQEILKTNPYIDKVVSGITSGTKNETEMSRGIALPGDNVDVDRSVWAVIKADRQAVDVFLKFFKNLPQDSLREMHEKIFSVLTGWIFLPVQFGENTCGIALPTISMSDTNGNIWFALAGTEDDHLVRTSEWVKYDPTNPVGTGAALCEMAVGKSLRESQKEEVAAQKRNRELIEAHNKKVAEYVGRKSMSQKPLPRKR